VAKLLLRDQQLIAGVMYPRGVYSRVVGCKQNWMIPPAWYGVWTPPIGQSFWLLAVDVWLSVFTPAGTLYHRIDLRTGFGSPQTGVELEQWERLVGFYDGAEMGDIEVYSAEVHIHLDMNRHFEGVNRRFGVRIYVGSDTHSVVNAAFQISEG